MENFTVVEITDKLIGNIRAWGETNEDERVIRRLDEVGLLVTKYIEDLVDNAKRVDDYRASIKQVAIKSNGILDQIKELMED